MARLVVQSPAMPARERRLAPRPVLCLAVCGAVIRCGVNNPHSNNTRRRLRNRRLKGEVPPGRSETITTVPWPLACKAAAIR